MGGVSKTVGFCEKKLAEDSVDDSASSNPENRAVGGGGSGPASQSRRADEVAGGTSDVSALLEQMRAGDRSAAALFITRYGSRIRRRIRGKLSPAMRRIFDSQEIMSTLGRRLDLFVRSGGLTATSEGELWALVFRMADNAVVDKARVFRRLEVVEDDDGPFAHYLLQRLRSAENATTDGADVEIGIVLSSISDQIDRQILYLWLAGIRHSAIAEHVDLAPTAVRKRWQKIRGKLHDQLAPDLGR